MTATSAAVGTGYIPRRRRKARIRGVFTESRIAFEAWLETRRGRLIVSDLGVGGWRPAQLATEIAAQIGMTLPVTPGAKLGLPDGGTLDVNTVGGWLDAEARGNSAILLADRAVRALVPMTAEMLLVVVPARAAEWRAADIWTLQFLAAAQAEGGCEVHLVHFGTQAPELPSGLAADWQRLVMERLDGAAAALLDPAPDPALAWLGMIPGIIAPPLAQALGIQPEAAMHLTLLSSGVALVPAELRALAAANMTAAANEFAERADSIPWLAPYAAMQGGKPAHDVLLTQAWRAFAAGAGDLACDCAAMAVSAAANTRDRVTALVSVQTMRLVEQDYAGLAAAESPPPGVPEDDRRRLDRFRAWGRALSGDGKGALDLFGAVPDSAPLDPQPWLDLYLRNIHALALFRIGEVGAALKLENDITVRLEGLRPISWHLRYLNALNLSRLYRARGDAAVAGQWLTKAEATTLGVALPSDLIHFNVLRARLAELDGVPDAARRHWHSAALIFAALPLPEALPWRVAAAIRGGQSGDVDPDTLAAAFLQHLGDEARTADISSASAFLLAEAHQPEGPLTAVGAPGWGMLVRSGRHHVPPFDSPNHAALRHRLSQRLPGGALVECTVFVDLRFGCGLPDTLEGLASSALWYGAEKILWDGHVLDMDRISANAEQRLHRAPGVAEIVGREVRFKRYRAPLHLSDASAPLAATDGRAIETLSDEEHQLAAALVVHGVLALETYLEPALSETGRAVHG